MLAINWFSLAVLLVNLALIQPNTSFQMLGYEISDRQSVLRHYFTRLFWADLLGWIVLLLYIVCNNYALIYLKIVFYVQLWTLSCIDTLLLSKL